MSYEREDSIQFIIKCIYIFHWFRYLYNLLIYVYVKRYSAMKHIDNLFTISYLIFGLFLVLVGVKDSAIYLWESVGLILVGGGLVVIATNVMIELMNNEG